VVGTSRVYLTASVSVTGTEKNEEGKGKGYGGFGAGVLPCDVIDTELVSFWKAQVRSRGRGVEREFMMGM
jgi:hypothetical protein